MTVALPWYVLSRHLLPQHFFSYNSLVRTIRYVYDCIQRKYGLLYGALLLCPILRINTVRLRAISGRKRSYSPQLRWKYGEPYRLTWVLIKTSNNQKFIRKVLKIGTDPTLTRTLILILISPSAPTMPREQVSQEQLSCYPR